MSFGLTNRAPTKVGCCSLPIVSDHSIKRAALDQVVLDGAGLPAKAATQQARRARKKENLEKVCCFTAHIYISGRSSPDPPLLSAAVFGKDSILLMFNSTALKLNEVLLPARKYCIAGVALYSLYINLLLPREQVYPCRLRRQRKRVTWQALRHCMHRQWMSPQKWRMSWWCTYVTWCAFHSVLRISGASLVCAQHIVHNDDHLQSAEPPNACKSTMI